jgi:dolichol-phosphate mannosyltransferase
MNSVLIVTPTYNERENVPLLLAGLDRHMPRADILVVDDNSPDGTGGLVEQLARTRANLHLLRRPGKQGLGTAYQEGFAWAFARGYERIVQMDCDLSHAPETVPALVAATEEADLALGSRYIPGGGTVGWPLSRKVLSRGANFYARTMLRLPLHDMTTGFRCWRAPALRALDPATLRANGYVFLVEAAYRASCLGLRIKEVPITFREREQGASKMGLHIAREGMLAVLRLAVGPRPHPRP